MKTCHRNLSLINTDHELNKILSMIIGLEELDQNFLRLLNRQLRRRKTPANNNFDPVDKDLYLEPQELLDIFNHPRTNLVIESENINVELVREKPSDLYQTKEPWQLHKIGNRIVSEKDYDICENEEEDDDEEDYDILGNEKAFFILKMNLNN